MARSRRHEIGVGLLVLVALALLAWMSLQVGSLHTGREVFVDAVFPDAAGLADGASVRVAGVEVGRVAGMAVDHDKARVHLSLKVDAALRRDVVAQVRARSVLGEKYVALLPQSADAPLLADGDVITDVRGQTEIDELVNAMGPLVGAVDPEALNSAMKTLARTLEDDPERAARMLGDAETLLHNAAVASADAPALVAETRTTLAEVRAVARDARPVLDRADGIVRRVDAATADLPATAEQLDALLADTRAAVHEGHEILLELDGSTDDLEKVLANLSEIDKWELRRLLREEGIKVRLRSSEVVPDDQ